MTDSKQIDDGGPAFAHPGGANDATVQTSHLGMSLRDWFAGQALVGMLSNPERVGNEAKFSGWASQAYFFADAMIDARKAGA